MRQIRQAILWMFFGGWVFLSGGFSYADGKGFQINRFEPTSAGEWSFFVPHPWYSKEPAFSFGLSMNYSHQPLSFGNLPSETTFLKTNVAVEHQWIAHIDIASSFFNRILVTASLPVVLLERGNAIGGVLPLNTINAGDPRFGATVRLFGEPMSSPFSVSVGASVWFPTNSSLPQESESNVRVASQIMLGGIAHRVFWSLVPGFYYRPGSYIGADLVHPRNTMGSQVTLAAALGYFDEKRNFSVGTEAMFDSIVTEGHPFQSESSHMEAFVFGQYRYQQNVHFGLALGMGFFEAPGTPDVRALFRLSYTFRSSVQKPKPPLPKPQMVPLCPLPPDEDHDGVPSPEDQCPLQPRGDHPDPSRPGCPDLDTDGDGVYDYYDQCPKEIQGTHPDLSPTHWGCPLPDRDKDGVFDINDQCPDVPEGPYGDKNRPGCPSDQPPACSSVAKVVDDKIEIYEKIYFATDQAKILSRSFPLLQAVADLLKDRVDISSVRIEGHTDDRNTRVHNLDLSKRRAQSVMDWLVRRGGIDKTHLQFEGYGPDRPIAPNTTEVGRAKNRRVEFKIVASKRKTDPASPSSQ